MDIVRRITMKRAADKKWLKTFEKFTPGDTVKVFVKIKEGEKERLQVYRGVVIKIQGSGLGKSFTVRKMSSGVGVERTFPFASPKLDKVEVVSRGKVSRSKLYYLRDLKGRAARLTSELVYSPGEDTASAEVAAGETTAAPKEKKSKNKDKAASAE